MRAVLTALNCTKGDIATNFAARLDVLAAADGGLVLFPEMSLTGSAKPARFDRGRGLPRAGGADRAGR
jgi:predicted amidohydrolase